MKNSRTRGGVPLFKNVFRYIFILKFLLLLTILSGVCVSGNIYASDIQQQVITGKVTDSQTGDAMPGVNIIVKGVTVGAISDVDGKYSIALTDRNATLVFSFIGYSTQEVLVTGKSVIDVALVSEALSLEEVVVIGYGTAQRRDLTGSIKSISMEDIPPAANINLTQSLAGRTAGLNVRGGSSLAGDEPSLSIRGQTSLSASDRPLIVLDGIIFQGAITDINIADVERIDVLKDASAAAVYGSRSANGVMLVTTKKGKRDRPSINFSSFAGFQDLTNSPVKMMNAEQYATRLVDYVYFQYLYKWYAKKPTGPQDQGGKPVRPDITNPDVIIPLLRSQDEVKNYLAGNEINWVDEVTRKGSLQNYDLNLSGSTDRTNYYISGSYSDQQGVLLNDNFKRTTLTTKVETNVTDWISLGLNTSYSYRNYSGAGVTMDFARSASPLASMYNESGIYPIDFNGEFLMRHPLRNLLIDNKDIRNNFFTTVYAKIKIPGIEGLSYDFNYSNNSTTTNNNTFIPTTVYEANATKGQATFVNSKESSWIINNIVSYSVDFSAKHRLNATLLYTRESRNGQNSNSYAEQFDNQTLGYNNLSFGKMPRVGSGAWDENSLGLMARSNYIFNNRYMFTGTVRKDGYSGFGSNKKYATFYSMSTAWVASEEAFVKNLGDWLNLLKLRISYGENGNQGIGRYSSLARMGVFTFVSGSTPLVGIYPSTLGNNDLGWEITKSLNFGLDYAVLNNRISGTIDVYTAHTNDVLVTRSLPGATGYTSVWTNIGKVNNKGVELELSTINLEGRFRWQTRFVFSLNRDKIADLYGDGKDDLGNSWFIGKPISAIYDYKRTGGLWTEEELYNGKTHLNFYPGQFRLADLNGDGIIDPNNDRSIAGYATPNYSFSISNDLSYNNFTLSFFINSIQGGKGYYLQNNRIFLEATSDYDYAQRANQPAVRQNWTPDNGVDNAPAVYNYPLVSSGNYQDRSFVRLQDLSLAYNVKGKVLNVLRLEGLELYISGKNLYTWTKWEGYDPEVGGSSLVMMKSIIGGLRINLK